MQELIDYIVKHNKRYQRSHDRIVLTVKSFKSIPYIVGTSQNEWAVASGETPTECLTNLKECFPYAEQPKEAVECEYCSQTFKDLQDQEKGTRHFKELYQTLRKEVDGLRKSIKFKNERITFYEEQYSLLKKEKEEFRAFIFDKLNLQTLFHKLRKKDTKGEEKDA